MPRFLIKLWDNYRRLRLSDGFLALVVYVILGFFSRLIHISLRPFGYGKV